MTIEASPSSAPKTELATLWQTPEIHDSEKRRVLELTLRTAGDDKLIPLLDSENETHALGAIRSWAKIVEEGKSARLLNGLSVLKLSRQRLPLIYSRSSPNSFDPTPITHLLTYTSSEFSINFVGIDGWALEAIGRFKPEHSSREMPSTISFGFGKPVSVLVQGPLIDLDLAIVAGPKASDLKIETMAEYMKTIVNQRRLNLQVVVVQSERRPNFKKIELKFAGKSICQMAFPIDINGESSAKNRLIELVMARPDVLTNLVLLSFDWNGTKPIATGAAIDFLDSRMKRQIEPIRPRSSNARPVTRSRGRGSHSDLASLHRERHRFHKATYRYPHVAFSQRCWPESFGSFTYLERTIPWAGLVPEIIAESVSPNDLRDSSRWIYRNIISPIAANPDLLGSPKQRYASCVALTESIQQAFDGDLLLALILSLDENMVQGCGYENTYGTTGMGLFSENGILNAEGQVNKLLCTPRKNGDTLISYIFKIAETSTLGGEEKVGWRTFLDLLFETLSPSEVAAILTPSFCPSEMKALFVEKILLPFDSRFKSHSSLEAIRVRSTNLQKYSLRPRV